MEMEDAVPGEEDVDVWAREPGRMGPRTEKRSKRPGAESPPTTEAIWPQFNEHDLLRAPRHWQNRFDSDARMLMEEAGQGDCWQGCTRLPLGASFSLQNRLRVSLYTNDPHPDPFDIGEELEMWFADSKGGGCFWRVKVRKKRSGPDKYPNATGLLRGMLREYRFVAYVDQAGTGWTNAEGVSVRTMSAVVPGWVPIDSNLRPVDKRPQNAWRKAKRAADAERWRVAELPAVLSAMAEEAAFEQALRNVARQWGKNGVRAARFKDGGMAAADARALARDKADVEASRASTPKPGPGRPKGSLNKVDHPEP